MSRAPAKEHRPALRNLLQGIRRLVPTFTWASFLSYAPLLVLVLAFYTVQLVMGQMPSPPLYLLLGVALVTGGVLGADSSAPFVLATVVLGETLAALTGLGSPLVAAGNAAGLLFCCAAIPVIARARILALGLADLKSTRAQVEARLQLGSRIARDVTPNPAAALQPVSGSEALVGNLLLFAKKALKARTAIFCWYNEANDTLVPVHSFSDVPELLTNCPVSIREGRLTALKASREQLAFRYDPNFPHRLPIYKKAIPVAGILAVPVYYRTHLAAAFLFDKEGTDPFFLPDTVLGKRLSELVEDSLVTERRMQSAVQLSEQLRQLNDAVKQLSGSRSFDQVYDTIARFAVFFAPFNQAVLAHRVSPAADEYEIVAVTRKSYAGLINRRFHLRGTLCELACRNRTCLPPNFVAGPRMPPPFGKEIGIELEEGEVCMLLPLFVRDQAVGFLLMADCRKKAVLRDDLGALFLLAECAGVSLLNTEANKELERMAVSDPLTGIPNLRAFMTRLREAVDRADRTKKPLSLLFADIDHFKAINDKHGHPAGDEVLRTVARTISQSVRKVDFVARYGGEEFVAILEEADASGSLIMAERLRTRIERLDLPALGRGQHISVSIGIATYPTGAHNLEELIVLADTALYRAKHEGRNNCQLA